MERSRRTDYAFRIIAAIAKNDKQLISVRKAAEDNLVPYSFARAIQHDLVNAGLIESVRGARGGMRLCVDPKEVTLLDVLEAIQGPIQINTCNSAGADNGPCERMAYCEYHAIWCGAAELLCNYLSSVTLFDVIHKTKTPSVSPEFCAPRLS